MKEIIFNFFSEIGQKLAVLLLVGTTAVTTGSAVAKLVSKPDVTEASTKQEQVVEQPKDNAVGGMSENKQNEVSPSPTIKITIKNNPSVTPTPTTKPFPIATLSVTPKPSAAVNNLAGKCIVTLFSKLYDVTTLRSTHSGGDIFKCGTDMTAVYTSRHGSNLSRMAMYEVSSNGQSVSNNTGSSSSVVNSRDSEENDDREDVKHEDRYVKEVEHDD